jgi:acetolactate synthase-1/2/3 large subunit
MTATSCCASARASTTASPAVPRRVLAELEEDPHRHRSVVDQQEHPRRYPIIGDCGNVLGDILQVFKSEAKKPDTKDWWKTIATWRARNSLAYKKNDDVILPQYAIQRLFERRADHDTYITTEVGQHQMWAAQFFGFEQPHRWMTSGGLGTMGYGLPAALGVQVAHPDSLVIDIAGDASVQMTMQEMSAAVQHELPIKIFILNNQYMGMVRQWQQLLHGNRLSHSYSEALPDFVKLAEAYGGLGLRCESPAISTARSRR